tara:strand:- start:218 stop:454 length:237 start_codon:yes stop_codon:yes gene_type:complete
VQGSQGATLRVRVNEAPEKGKANAALIKLLAREWNIPRSRLSVVRGQKNRRKSVLVHGEPSRLLSTLQGWVKQHVEGD